MTTDELPAPGIDDIFDAAARIAPHAHATPVLTSRALDAEKYADNPEVRQHAEDFVALMTPIVKALFTDLGTLCANHGMQVLGGHGYIREWGMEQYARDARIAQIYEGTNGIQALDLAGRKMPAHAGRYLRRFFHPVLSFIEAHEEDERMGEFILPLSKAFGRLQQCTAELARRGLSDPTEIGAGATDYLRLFGLTAQLSKTPGAITTPPPRLGEHTAELLAGLGYSREDVAALKAKGVV